MDRNEFNEWWDDISAGFPQMADWVAKNGGVALLSRWLDVLSDISLADALEANRRFARGDADFPKAFERESLPSFVRVAVNMIQGERRRAAENEELLKPRAKSGRFPAGEMFRRLLKLQETMSHERAVEQMRKEFCE